MKSLLRPPESAHIYNVLGDSVFECILCLSNVDTIATFAARLVDEHGVEAFAVVHAFAVNLIAAFAVLGLGDFIEDPIHYLHFNIRDMDYC